MGSIAQVTVDRAKVVEPLQLSTGTTSQWLNAAKYRSCFCIAKTSVPAIWTVQGLLPDGQIVDLVQYPLHEFFEPSRPRYISVSAMCGLPIRFVASQPQLDSQLWIVFKS